MLATDELVLKATTATTDLAALISQVWARQLERNLRKRAVFEQSAVVNTDLAVPKGADRVFIPILPDLAAAVSLTEGTPMAVDKLNTATSVELLPAEWGKTIEISRKALDRLAYDGMAATLDRLAYSMSLAIEGRFASLYNVVVPGTANTFLSYYPNGHASATLVTTDTFSGDALIDAVALLQEQDNFPFDDGYYRCYITPKQYSDMMKDTNVRQDLRFAAPKAILNGEVGALHGCRIVVTNYINTALEGATSNVTAYKAMLVAPRWAAVAYKRRPQVVVDPTLYDMGRIRRFGVTADFDIEPLHHLRAVAITTA